MLGTGTLAPPLNGGRRLIDPYRIPIERNLPMIRLISIDLEPAVVGLSMMVWAQHHNVQMTQRAGSAFAYRDDVMRLCETNPVPVLECDRKTTEHGANLTSISLLPFDPTSDRTPFNSSTVSLGNNGGSASIEIFEFLDLRHVVGR